MKVKKISRLCLCFSKKKIPKLGERIKLGIPKKENNPLGGAVT